MGVTQDGQLVDLDGSHPVYRSGKGFSHAPESLASLREQVEILGDRCGAPYTMRLPFISARFFDLSGTPEAFLSFDNWFPSRSPDKDQHGQWRNSRGQGGRVPHDNSHREIFCWRTGKREGRENRREKKKNLKREGWKLKMEGGKVAFYFSHFKSTEICFGSTKMRIFYR